MVTTHRLFWLGRVIIAVDLVRIVSVTEEVCRPNVTGCNDNADSTLPLHVT